MSGEQQIITQEKVIPMPTNQNFQLSAEGLIAQGIERGLSVDSLERLLAMRRELRAEKAKEAFDEAMAQFQGECPTIKKKKDGGRTESGVVAYKYAPLEMIVEQVKEIIQKHGFSYAIKTEMGAGRVKATCIVKHKFGHSEDSTMDVPLGTKTRVMSDPQVVAATATFAKRYAFCNAFGIMTGEDDTDAVTKSASTTAPKPIPAKTTPVSPKGKTPDLECHECAAIITEPEWKFSKNRYGKPLCREHQATAKQKK